MEQTTPSTPGKDNHGTKRDKTSPSHTSPNQIVNPTKKTKYTFVEYTEQNFNKTKKNRKSRASSSSDTVIPSQPVPSSSSDVSTSLTTPLSTGTQQDSISPSLADNKLLQLNTGAVSPISTSSRSRSFSSNKAVSSKSTPDSQKRGKRRYTKNVTWEIPNHWKDLKFGADTPVHPVV
jgi:hypothetical protein